MANQGELMGIFWNLISGKAPVRLLNTYRGLSFNYPADILRVEGGTVAARVHRHQAVSMATEGRTHIRGNPFKEVIRANVVEVDYQNREAILSEFIGVGDTVGKRTSVRVQPGDPIDAQISDGRTGIKGKIADISTNGLCIFTITASMYTLSFGLDREVFVDFVPPRYDSVVRFTGVITNIREQEGSHLYRLGLRIFPRPEVGSLLEEYVSWQQQAILREIELAYYSMSQEKIRHG